MEYSFGERIRNLRESKKMTLKELSSLLEIDTSMLGKIEKGTRKANVDIIHKLAQIFEVSESELNVSMISDQIANQVVKKYNQQAQQILKVAEEKVAYKSKNEMIKE
ncbi:MAG: helix-turn-helix transcriptional regulator [Cytophagales bacterium]|nr:helix-turn-helix transcriptional regulator [Cytophagales bacterium]